TRAIWAIVIVLAMGIGVVAVTPAPATAAPFLRALPWDGCPVQFPNCSLSGLNRYEDELFRFRIEVEDGVTPVWSGDLPAAASIGGVPVGSQTEVEGGLMFEWQPTEADGTLEPFPLNTNLRGAYFNITISATDATGTSSVDVYLRVEERQTPPVIEILNRSHTGAVPIGDTITFDVVGTDTDLPAATSISYELPPFGSPDGTSIDPETGAFSWTTSPGQDGSYLVAVYAIEHNPYDVRTAGVAEVPIAVGTGNRPPVVDVAEPAMVIDPGGTAYTELEGYDLDEPEQELTWGLRDAPPGALLMTDEWPQAFEWSSTEADAGRTYEFFIELSDGITTTSVPVSVQVTGTAVDAPPSITPIDDVTIDELTRLFFEPVVADPDGDPFDLVWEGTPPGAVINGIFDWTPTEAQGPGVYEVTLFAIQADDPNLFDSETFTITVDEVPEPPVLELPALPSEIPPDEPFVFDADATDPDLPADDLTFSLVGAPTGASIDPATGEFSWTPTVGQSGPVSFDVVVSDGSLTDVAEVSVVVGEAVFADVGITRFEVVDGDLDTAGAIRSPGPAILELDYAANALFDDAPGTTLVIDLGVVPDFGVHNGALFGVTDLPAACATTSDASGITTGIACDLGTVTAGTGDTLSFTLQPSILLFEVGNYDVELELAARIESTVPDPFPTNNDSTITPELRARQADLSAAIGRPPSWTGDPAFLGEVTPFVFYVDHLGPDLAANTTATVDWGPGVWEIASLPPTCTAATSSSFTCELGDLPAGEIVPTEFALAEIGGDGANHRITVTLATDTIDPVAANNSATTRPVPVARSSDVSVDLELFVGDDDGIVAPRDRLTYRATVYNGGPHDSIDTNLGIEFVGHYGEVTVVDDGGCTPFDGSFPLQPQGLACPIGLLASPFGFTTIVFTVDVPLDETDPWVVGAEAFTGSTD
ncbi:MAG: putative Ig domain-containing protein, partial [Acidimicrobiia bacterium]